MRYISTRGQAPAMDFAGATLAGLASDGGLYVPAAWPRLDRDAIAAMRGRPYQDVAYQVMAPFIGGAIDARALRTLIDKAYGAFHHSAVAPLSQLDARHWLLALYHGPTLAFKDFALQFLGHVFEHLLAASRRALTIVGATSGDTGSAAIHAVAGCERIEIFMLHPEGRVSEVQRRQMTTVMAPNVHNIAVAGTFDDCQALVKELFADAAFREQLSLSAVNSINWARVMAQAVYYFYAAVQLGAPDRAVAFAVPTGNFGDAFAGYVAARMGLPVARLIVATNINDIMARAFETGDYSVGTVQATMSPSMDIQVASNFERLLFDLYGRDGEALRRLMEQFRQSRALRIPHARLADVRALFCAQRVDEEETAHSMRRVHEETGCLIDPHTAVAVAAAFARAPEERCPV
ncbi:MAG: threonine synthase, partial [Alphaproteobacteria bacterium]